MNPGTGAADPGGRARVAQHIGTAAATLARGLPDKPPRGPPSPHLNGTGPNPPGKRPAKQARPPAGGAEDPRNH
jgi:hypothetical protein